MTNDELMQRESARAGASDVNLVMIHQDAFAADYQDDEYMLLGMAIKYAGLRGKEVRAIRKNRQTLGEGERIQRTLSLTFQTDLPYPHARALLTVAEEADYRGALRQRLSIF
jgi:hypothetical protein